MIATRKKGFCRRIVGAVVAALGGWSTSNRGQRHNRSPEWEDKSLVGKNVERMRDENDE